MSKLMRILLIDDDDDFVLLMKTALELSGFAGELEVASDSDKACVALQRELPDLVLIDVRLQRSSGFEILEWIRSRPDLNRMPVKILAGLEVESDAQRAMALGAGEYVVKPLEFGHLVELAERLQWENVETRLAA